MADISLNGVTPASPPGVYVNVNYNGGSSGGAVAPYSVLLLGNMTSQGSAFPGFVAGQVFGPDTLVSCSSTVDANNLFGFGSPLALMYAAFTKINNTTPVYLAPVTTATGTAASLAITITVAGTGRTSGTVSFQVDGKPPVQASYGLTDTAATIATNLAAAINANVNLPVTASASAAVVTVTAKTAGARGNNLRGFSSASAGSGVSVSTTAPTNFSSGAGSDLAGYTATLAGLAVNGQRYYYYVPEAGCDNIDGYTGAIASSIDQQLAALAQPAVGLRQRAIMGSNDTLAHTTAVTAGLNYERMETIWLNQCDQMPSEMAAIWAACVTLTETTPLTAQDVNFDSFGATPGTNGLLQISAPLSGVAPSQTDVNTAIISGITPVRVGPGRQTSIVKRCTTRFFTLGGPSNNQQVLDLRVTDGGVVTIADRFFDDLSALIAQRHSAKVINKDPVAGAPPPGPGVVTPSLVRDTCLEVIQNYASSGLIDGNATSNGLVVQVNTVNNTSIGISVPLYVSNLAHQFLIQGTELAAIVL